MPGQFRESARVDRSSTQTNGSITTPTVIDSSRRKSRSAATKRDSEDLEEFEKSINQKSSEKGDGKICKPEAFLDWLTTTTSEENGNKRRKQDSPAMASSNDGEVLKNDVLNIEILNDDVLREIFSRLPRSDLLNCALASKRLKSIMSEIVARGKLDVTYELLDDLSNPNKNSFAVVGQNNSQRSTNGTPRSNRTSKSSSSQDPQNLEALVKRFYMHATHVAVECGAKLDNVYLSNFLNLHHSLKRLTLCHQLELQSCFCRNLKSSSRKQQFEQLEILEMGSMFKTSCCWIFDVLRNSPRLSILKFRCPFFYNVHHINDLECIPDIIPGSLKQLHWPIIENPTGQVENCCDVGESGERLVEFLVKHSQQLDVLDAPIRTVSNLCSQGQLRNITRLGLRLNERWMITRENRQFLSSIKYLAQLKSLKSLELRSFEFCEDVVENNPDAECRYQNELDSYKKIFWETLGKLPDLSAISLFGAWEFNRTCRQVSKFLRHLEYLRINLLPEDVKEVIRGQGAQDVCSFNVQDGLSALKRIENLRSLHIMCSETLQVLDKKSIECMRTDHLDKIWAFDFRVVVSEDIEELLFELHRRGLRTGRTYLITFVVDTRSNNSNNSTKTKKILVKMGMKIGHDSNLIIKSLNEFHAELDCHIYEQLVSSERCSAPPPSNDKSNNNFSRGINQCSSIVMTQLRAISMKDSRTHAELTESWKKYFGPFTIDKRYFI